MYHSIDPVSLAISRDVPGFADPVIFVFSLCGQIHLLGTNLRYMCFIYICIYVFFFRSLEQIPGYMFFLGGSAVAHAVFVRTCLYPVEDSGYLPTKIFVQLLGPPKEPDGFIFGDWNI